MYVEFGSMFWDKFCLVFKNRIIHKSQTPFIKIVDFWDCHLHNWKNQSVFAHTNGLVSSAHAWPVATLCAIAQKRGETGIIPFLQFPNCKNRRNLGRRVKRTTPQRWITKKKLWLYVLFAGTCYKCPTKQRNMRKSKIFDCRVSEYLQDLFTFLLKVRRKTRHDPSLSFSRTKLKRRTVGPILPYCTL